MTQEQAPEHRTPQTSIRLLKLHARRSAILLPKNGGRVMGRSLSPEVMKELRDNLAAELRELRQYPEEVTLEEARRLRSEHDKISDARSATVAAKGVKVPYAKH